MKRCKTLNFESGGIDVARGHRYGHGSQRVDPLALFSPVLFEYAMSFRSCRSLIAALLVGFVLFASGFAHAGIVRSSNGSPVLSTNGNCVISNWQGSEDCGAAKGEEPPKADVGAQPLRNIEATIYFDFNKSSLTAKAKRTLGAFAKKFKSDPQSQTFSAGLTVVGYTDRIGTEPYNDALASKRAHTVYNYLARKGLKVAQTEVRSDGKQDAKSNCPKGLPAVKLIDCLKDDRRVEIQIGAQN